MSKTRQIEPPHPLPWKWMHDRRWELVDANGVELVVAMGHTTGPPEVSVDKATREYLIRCANAVPALLAELEKGYKEMKFSDHLRAMADYFQHTEYPNRPQADWLRFKASRIESAIKLAKGGG